MVRQLRAFVVLAVDTCLIPRAHTGQLISPQNSRSKEPGTLFGPPNACAHVHMHRYAHTHVYTDKINNTNI